MEEASAASLPLINDESETVAEQPEKTELAGITLPEPVQAKDEKSTDWLSGHLDLLNKLQ